MNLVNYVATLRAELAEREAALAFVERNLPSELVSKVEEFNVRKDESLLRIRGDLNTLMQLMQVFPPRTTQQYLATHTGYPVSRETAQLLNVTEAAIPVHAAWKSESDILGSAVNWITSVENKCIRVMVTGAISPETTEWLWPGLTPICNVKGITLMTTPIRLPEVPPELPESLSPQAMLTAIVDYLNDEVAKHGASCRGFAPAAVVTYLAQAHFKLPIEVSLHRYTWTGSIPDRAFTVSLRDSHGKWWHELGKVRQPYRAGNKADTLWYDLVPLTKSLV